MRDWRIVIAYSEPPPRFRFMRAKSGKTWFRKIEGRNWALKLGQDLAAIGIHGVIRKPDDGQPISKSARNPNADIAAEEQRQEQRLLDRDQQLQAKRALAAALRGQA